MATRLTRSHAIRLKSAQKEGKNSSRNLLPAQNSSNDLLLRLDKCPRGGVNVTSTNSSPSPTHPFFHPLDCSSTPSLISFSSLSPSSTSSDFDGKQRQINPIPSPESCSNKASSLLERRRSRRSSGRRRRPPDNLPLDELPGHSQGPFPADDYDDDDDNYDDDDDDDDDDDGDDDDDDDDEGESDNRYLVDNVDAINSNIIDESAAKKMSTDGWSLSTSESRESVKETSPTIRITNSVSLYETKAKSHSKVPSTPKTDHSFSGSSAHIFQTPGIDDVIKSSRSLPSRLNKNSKRDKNDWRSLDLRPIRTEGKRLVLDEIMADLKETKKFIACIDESEILARRVKKSLYGFLNITPKLHKCFKRGLYLVSLVHQGGKVLVTTEDSLPALAVRCEQNPSESTLKWDFNWFAKVLCNWSNVKTLKRTFERPRNISDSAEFRFRLVETTCHMQKIIGLECLGTLHYQLLADPNSGSHVFLLVTNLSDDAKVNNYLKWCSIGKLRRRKSQNSRRSGKSSTSSPTWKSPSILPRDHGDIMETIALSIPELISFHVSCTTKLSRGLYLGYVKLTSSIDQLRIMVPKNLPNVFPHVKIRQESRVSREDWESITNANREDFEPSGRQEIFRRKLFGAARGLLVSTGVPEENIPSHRLYVSEVFEFSHDVSFVLLLPDNKNVCSGIGEEENLRPGYMTLPLHQFEIYHMSTYHPDLTKRYSHVSTLMEAEVSIFNHLLRQEVSQEEDELKLREQISLLNLQQKKLDEIWKSMRWISEVISNARDGRNSCGVFLDRIKPCSPDKDP